LDKECTKNVNQLDKKWWPIYLLVVVTVGVESEDGDDLYVVDGRELTNARCGFWLLDVH
jgi:hypothetical protein